MNNQEISPKELKLTKSNNNSTRTLFLYSDMKQVNGSFHIKIHDKRSDYDFPIVNVTFLDGDISEASSYSIYISQLVRFARICNKV